jgi:hypothetical protein
MVKKRTRSEPTQDQIDAFASNSDEHKEPAKTPEKKAQKSARTTISLPASMLEELEDLARANKRSDLPNKTVSAIIRAALDKSMK